MCKHHSALHIVGGSDTEPHWEPLVRFFKTSITPQGQISLFLFQQFFLNFFVRFAIFTFNSIIYAMVHFRNLLLLAGLLVTSANAQRNMIPISKRLHTRSLAESFIPRPSTELTYSDGLFKTLSLLQTRFS